MALNERVFFELGKILLFEALLLEQGHEGGWVGLERVKELMTIGWWGKRKERIVPSS